MNRHPFRWESLAFGLLFLAVVGTWSAWTSGLLDSDELAYAPAGVLIVLGAAGIIASFASPRRAVAPPAEPESETDAAADESEVGAAPESADEVRSPD